MNDFHISATARIIEKILVEHQVDLQEVEEAFYYWVGKPLIDDRVKHRTKPPTVWFCSATSEGRILKIVGIPDKKTKEFILKSAFTADDWEIDLYEENQ